jgi:hypothetical protein
MWGKMLLPKPCATQSMAVPQSGPTMRGLLIHHSLVLHLIEDMLPGDSGSQLGELLDLTKTEDKQPLLLIFTAKMAVLLQLAQDPDGLRELANSRTIYRFVIVYFVCMYIHLHILCLYLSRTLSPSRALSLSLYLSLAHTYTRMYTV